MRLRVAGVFFLLSLCSFAQQTPQSSIANAQVTVPHLIRISGQMQPANGTVGVTFSLYKSQNDSAPLWAETQNIKLDASGKYTAVVGVTKAEGIPLELFANGEAQWLGIHREGQAEQPRILLVSVPYAMKAAEAETLAGHTASEFVTQQNLGDMVQLKLQEPEIRTVLANPFVTATTPVTDGATNFTDSTTNQIMLVTQNGTGKLIVGEGPSHTPVFSVDQTGVVRGTRLTLDASASRTINMGNNPVSGGGGFGLVVEAGLPAFGTANKRGGELVLAAGTGTGDGGSGDVVIRTAAPQASGTAGDTLTSRHVYASSPVNMGAASGSVNLAAVEIPAGGGGGLGIRFKIYATDGGLHVGTAVAECILVSYVNAAGNDSQAYVVMQDYAEISATGDVINPSCSYYAGVVGTWGPQINDAVNFTPTVHTITYEIENLSEWPLQLLANTSSAHKMPIPEGAVATPAHPRVHLKQDADGKVTVVEDPEK